MHKQRRRPDIKTLMLGFPTLAWPGNSELGYIRRRGKLCDSGRIVADT